MELGNQVDFVLTPSNRRARRMGCVRIDVVIGLCGDIKCVGCCCGGKKLNGGMICVAERMSRWMPVPLENASNFGEHYNELHCAK